MSSTCSSSTPKPRTVLTRNVMRATPTVVSWPSSKAVRMISTTATQRLPTIRSTAQRNGNTTSTRLYLQDEWVTAGGALTLVFGLRYDWYTAAMKPAFNQNFFDRHGYANTHTIDGRTCCNRVSVSTGPSPLTSACVAALACTPAAIRMSGCPTTSAMTGSAWSRSGKA